MFYRTCRRILPLTLALLLIISCVPIAYTADFSDVPRSHWAYSYIHDAVDRKLIQGYGDRRFHPEEPVSVQAFLSMVCRTDGLDDRQLQSGSNWADPAVAYGSYFGWFEPKELGVRTASPKRLPYVRAAAALGLIEGYEDGTFRPEQGLTRAAAAKLLSRCAARPSAVSGETVQVPVLMYHDVSYLGRGYSKTPEIFEQQMRELKDAGFHTVFFSQVIDYVEHGTPLPEKPIVITFDDGYATNYTYVFPILQELDMKIELSVIGKAIRYADWGLRWDQIREMTASGLVSIEPHTNGLHESTDSRTTMLKIPAESWTEYVCLVGDDTRQILDQITEETGSVPQTFTYPLGKYNAMTEAIVQRMGCKVSLTTKDGVARVVRGDPSSLRLMDRIGMDFRNGSVISVLKQFGYKG